MSEEKHRYFVLHKPYNMVSQFVSSHEVVLLNDLDFSFPEGTHAIGRLDNNSEGLLLLTTNKSITRKLFSSRVPHSRKYLVQVKYEVSEESLERLRKGVSIQVKGGGYYTTIACDAELVANPFDYVQEVDRKFYGASSWVMLTLTEGKFHQVRKMVDAVGHKCIRLIRIAIENIELGSLAPGQVREMDEKDFFEQLKISH